MLKIGDVNLNGNVFLAPMAGVTDLPFRMICKDMGASLVYTEMISCKGLYYKDEKTKELTSVDERERPIAVQIFGSEPSIMRQVVSEYLNDRDDIDIIDINMGCPAPKIVRGGEGSALMKSPNLIRQIIKEIVDVSKKPVTIKIRKGWDDSNINAVEIAKIGEEEGISAITIHGRTRSMFYSGEADWDIIKEIKEVVSIPVIGNGDIFTVKDGMRMLEYTNCDAIMIGRGARGNPWIFKNILEYMNDEKVNYPTDDEKIEKAIEHLELVCDFKGEKTGVREMRKHIAWYLKGLKGANQIKNSINTIQTLEGMKTLLRDYTDSLKR
ncbi:tRNA dihydrouridine synthase DusB [Sporanaerobacter acetigenes]|uniref:tRNA-dihydrouridine synthase n=1 Tax=Sporanaerobacter acetigenes DSM 13106 TaxID=1123281 RepID=A0A1M5Y887_9FIRM|nr:tRNA dihydrouridine synthase DusB [Sporanaerobacter acetigenes]SHI07693.1 tRNA-U20-dihydrouridine synthase [Sporanaerobacter acetigenes DSM 13106]